jgi:hypothetical protein
VHVPVVTLLLKYATASWRLCALIAALVWSPACAKGGGDHAMRADAVSAGDGKDAALPTSSGSVVVLDDGGPRIQRDIDATLLDAGVRAISDASLPSDAAVLEAGSVDGAAPDAMEPLPFVNDGAVRAGSGGIGGNGGSGGIGGIGGVGGFGGQ